MILEEIAQLLADSGIGVFDTAGRAGSIFINYAPDTPSRCISIYGSSGVRGDGTPHYFPSVQIRIRDSIKTNSGWDLAMRVYDTLQYWCDRAFVAGGEHVVRCDAVQAGPISLGPDEKGRQVYTLNFELIVARARA